jgi:hypothetical protein
MSATDYLENLIINHLLRTDTWSKPSNIYIGLFTTQPNDAGTGGTEVSGGSYARVSAGPADAYWNAPSTGSTYNSSDITFPSPTADWGTVVAVGFFDASTSGNLLHHEALNANRSILNGDPAPKFSTGDLTFTVD